MPRLLRAALLLIGAGALCAVIAPASAATGSLSVSPANQSVEDGSPFSVAVMQNADVATSGAQTDFTFDPALVHVVSVDKGSAYAAASLVIGVAPQTVEQAIAEANNTGTLQNISAFFLPGGGSVPAGPATAVVVNMQAAAATSGVSQISLSETEMLDTGGELVPVTVSGGEVVVGDGPALVWGDVDCGGAVNAVDALALLRSSSGLGYNSGPGCPEIGILVESRMWGDVNCGGSVNAVDGLAVLRSSAGLGYNSGPGCPEIGSGYP